MTPKLPAFLSRTLFAGSKDVPELPGSNFTEYTRWFWVLGVQC